MGLWSALPTSLSFKVPDIQITTRGVIHKKKKLLEKLFEKFIEMYFCYMTCPNFLISWKNYWAYLENRAFLVLRFQSWFTWSKNHAFSIILSRNFSISFSIIFSRSFFLVNHAPDFTLKLNYLSDGLHSLWLVPPLVIQIAWCHHHDSQWECYPQLRSPIQMLPEKNNFCVR